MWICLSLKCWKFLLYVFCSLNEAHMHLLLSYFLMSWPFIIMKCPSFSLVIKSTSSDMNIAIPAFLCFLLFSWYVLLAHFTFRPFALCLTYVSHRQHVFWFLLFKNSDNICCLIWSLLTLNVIIDVVVFRSTILVFVLFVPTLLFLYIFLVLLG